MPGQRTRSGMGFDARCASGRAPAERLSGSPNVGGSERPKVSDLANVLSWAQDEAELVTELQAGSDAAFDWLVSHYHAPVYNLVLGMLGDVSDAADATQEVFLKAFRGIGKFRRGSSLKTWLYRIAIREALNQRRWFWRHRRHQTSIDEEPTEGTTPLELEDLSATPFEQLETREVQAVIRRALARVPKVFRSAVILRDLEGLAYEEIAEVLEANVGTVKSRILRGRRVLREVLEPLLDPSRKLPGKECFAGDVSARAGAPARGALGRQHSSIAAAGLTMAQESFGKSSERRPFGIRSAKEGAR
jgi:RNA polymerase sigma-70 factor (ECF subfamily)